MILFSIIIPTFNGEKTVGKLLKKIVVLENNFNHSNEVIIIDSQSQDKTLSIVEKFKSKLNLKIYQIKKEEFNHGLTRNYGVSLARGKFIWFLSQDAIPISKNILNYYLEDFSINKKVVAIFGKNIPYKNTPFIQKIEIFCRWQRLDKYIDKKGLLIQNLEKLSIFKKNLLDFFVLSNTSCCYKKSFLIKNPFPKTDYGEDLAQGENIIKKGLIKIYDTRCSVYHSHFFNIFQYYKREKEDINLRINMKIKLRSNFMCKLKKIISSPINPFLRIYYIFELFFYYFLKLLIILILKILKTNDETSFRYPHA